MGMILSVMRSKWCGAIQLTLYRGCTNHTLSPPTLSNCLALPPFFCVSQGIDFFCVMSVPTKNDPLDWQVVKSSRDVESGGRAGLMANYARS